MHCASNRELNSADRVTAVALLHCCSARNRVRAVSFVSIDDIRQGWQRYQVPPLARSAPGQGASDRQGAALSQSQVVLGSASFRGGVARPTLTVTKG